MQLRYRTVYYFLLVLSAALPLLFTVITLNDNLHEGNTGRISLITSMLLLPVAPVTLLLSIYNLIRRKDIAWYVSIIGAVITAGLVIVGGMIFMISGAGLVG